ncbi:MAG: hypothetical protein HKN49_07905 [Gammaproteobacteria bacterium]|nr:hypothetical protein [Gammaproteobacteria bacterium]
MRYSELVTDHFEHPRNVATAAGGRVGRAGDRRRGAIVEFYLELDNGRVASLRFRAWGCPHTIAVASWLTGALADREQQTLLPLELDNIATELGLPTDKWHCILTAEDALRAALEEKDS